MDIIDNDILSDIYENNKLLYIFGNEKLEEIEKSVILITNEQDMEAISSYSFYFSETMNMQLCLCIYEPEGDFSRSERVIEHYETLSHILQYSINIEQKVTNPLRALSQMDRVIQIAPMKRGLKLESIFTKLSTNINDHILRDDGHPKLLIPAEAD